ncbi:uncharacterized protein LOC130679362 [Manis pentadactyla]|uniref:uncharacterized protein LOC130679362 n=1 Tax=Manis pentadactyla TaxID=143292 RepID=UPI00255CAFC5|nr:uncharacterized protein LOC130679362 [Manis pentadactyla]
MSPEESWEHKEDISEAEPVGGSFGGGRPPEESAQEMMEEEEELSLWQHHLIALDVQRVSRSRWQRALSDEHGCPPQQLHHWDIWLWVRTEWENWSQEPFLGRVESELPGCSWPEHTLYLPHGQHTSGHVWDCSHHLGLWSYDPDHPQQDQFLSVWQYHPITLHVLGASRPRWQWGLWDERGCPQQQLHHKDVPLCGKVESENWWYSTFRRRLDLEIPGCCWTEYILCLPRGQHASEHICVCSYHLGLWSYDPDHQQWDQ